MEDKRSVGGGVGHESGGPGARVIGPKVSQIANIFQSKAGNAPVATANVGVNPEMVHPSHVKTRGRDASVSPKHDAKEHHHFRDLKCSADNSIPSQITVVRTESHVARFNSAKALFEKLGTSK